MKELPKFNIEPKTDSIIKVIGVGGGGSNAVNYMYEKGIRDVDFVVCNTDRQALELSQVPHKLQIGVNLTEGRGAGANPEVGQNAALESKEEFKELLSHNTKMLFITTGMGGGTGTGASPVLAQIARELDILTVGVVTTPFDFEGKLKRTHAEDGIKELSKFCDTVIIIENERLLDIFGQIEIKDAFSETNEVLASATKGISEIITIPGGINVDFEDVKTVLKDSGNSIMGFAHASGENRARKAVEEVLASPLLGHQNIHGAQRILLSIYGDNITTTELKDITNYIKDFVGEDVIFIWGYNYDEDMGDKIKIILIASGFEGSSEGISTSKMVTDLESGESTNIEENLQEDIESSPSNYEYDEAIEKTLETLEDETEESALEIEHNPSFNFQHQEGEEAEPTNGLSEEERMIRDRQEREQELEGKDYSVTRKDYEYLLDKSIVEVKSLSLFDDASDRDDTRNKNHSVDKEGELLNRNFFDGHSD